MSDLYWPVEREEHNPWRRLVEARVIVAEAQRLIRPGKGLALQLENIKDAIDHLLDGAGYNDWEYRYPIGGRHENHEKVSPWPGRHTRGAGGPRTIERLRKGPRGASRGQ